MRPASPTSAREEDDRKTPPSRYPDRGEGTWGEDAPVGLEAQLDRLEAAIARLEDGSAPLEELVSAYEEAARLLEAAQARLDKLTERAHSLSR